MLHRIRLAALMVRREGLRKAVTYALDRVAEERYERSFGVRTRGQIGRETLGISNPDSADYAPASYGGFFSAMRHVSEKSGAFVDYGSGLGRILVAAATFPFVRITGIELSPTLVERCKRNLGDARQVELLCMDAARYRLPSDVTVFHFFEPFRGETLQAVVREITRSLNETPRRAWIVYANPWYMEPLMRAGDIIPRAWQKSAVDEMWPFMKPDPNRPNANRYRVYALDSR
jgi:Methyltransferase domain